MSNLKKLSHVLYRCSDHIFWTPKYRYYILEGLVKEQLSRNIHMLIECKDCELLEMNIQSDHVHLIASVPPKLSVSKLMGILKGKTVIKIFKSYPQLKVKRYLEKHFWSRGYSVDTIGLDEEKIKKYFKYQVEKERIEEQHRLNFDPYRAFFQAHLQRMWFFNNTLAGSINFEYKSEISN